MDQLRSQGWSETAIEAWAKKDQDMARALLRYVTASASGMELDSDECQPQWIRAMFDGGTFDHMFGTSLMATGCVTHLRKVKPVPCRIAKGFMWLDTKGDAVLPNGLVLRDGFVNPHNEISLISEGKLALFEAWSFLKNVNGLEFSWPPTSGRLGGTARALQQGVLFYVPKDMMPAPDSEYVCSIEQTDCGHNPLYMESFDQESAMDMNDEEAAAAWMQFNCMMVERIPQSQALTMMAQPAVTAQPDFRQDLERS
jgi:hypothetical protein